MVSMLAKCEVHSLTVEKSEVYRMGQWEEDIYLVNNIWLR